MTDPATPTPDESLALDDIDEYEALFAAAVPESGDLLSDLSRAIVGMQKFNAWCDAHGGPKRVNAELAKLARRGIQAEDLLSNFAIGDDLYERLSESGAAWMSRRSAWLAEWNGR
jgi:hypothetical protein